MSTPARRDAVEREAMLRALTLAALGSVQGPNPRVGCVLLDTEGATLAEGYHRGAGTAHAEADALSAAAQRGVDVRGATAVVTLEPCTHQGLTPPCAQALIAAGIARVVIAVLDPNPQAAGGVALLRQAGVDVATGLLARESEALNLAWLYAIRHARPYVIWKFAATLDGRSAAADGTSQWITSEQARADVHARRARVDAIAVGTGTVLVDDPALTVRGVPTDIGWRPPTRVVIGERDLPPSARVLDGAAPTLHLPTRDLDQVMAQLHERQIRSLWLEGGPQLAAAFWRAGLIQEVIAYLAPVLLGAGRTAVGDLGITTIGGAARLELIETAVIGGDLMLRARPASGPTQAPQGNQGEGH